MSSTLSVVLAMVLGIAGCAGAAPSSGSEPRALPTPGRAIVGAPAPEITARWLGGSPPKTLAEARGTVVLIHFWASGHEPTRTPLFDLREISEANPGRVFVVVVGINDMDVFDNFMLVAVRDQCAAACSIFVDDDSTARAYAPFKLPATYVIDKKGIVRFLHYSPREVREFLPGQVASLIAEG